TPGVVAPVDHGALALAAVIAPEENGTVIAAPRFVSREGMEVNALEGCFVPGKQGTDRGLHLQVPDVDVHLLALDKVADQLRIDRGDLVVFVGKADARGPR